MIVAGKMKHLNLLKNQLKNKRRRSDQSHPRRKEQLKSKWSISNANSIKILAQVQENKTHKESALRMTKKKVSQMKIWVKVNNKMVKKSLLRLKAKLRLNKLKVCNKHQLRSKKLKKTQTQTKNNKHNNNLQLKSQIELHFQI